MEIIDAIAAALGVDQQVQDLSIVQMVMRACVVYVFTLLLIKAAKKRFMGKSSAFDVVMIIILGSVISRAINGSAPFVPTLFACVALIAMHRIVSWLTFRNAPFARFVEGEAWVLARDGRLDLEQMRKHDITEKDVQSALRQFMNSDDLSQAKAIVLEPNGKLSVVKK